ncbi:MAG: hypothetical protein ACTSYB_16045 [Candidatus Helarchaeota archaeon]
MKLEYSHEIVKKTLDFIDDKNLQVVIENRLDELERVFLVNANLSTIILSISCIEGIFKHVANVFKAEIRASTKYPKISVGKNKGNKKKFKDLTIEEIYQLLLERDILQHIDNFDHIYALFRNYRNFIHPKNQKDKSWPVGLGQSQMALGLLNATIDQISKYIFIGPEILVKITGRPRYDLSQVLHLDTAETRTHSFLIIKRKIDSLLDISLNVELSADSVFNFVFNYVDESNFKMLRLDNRDLQRTPNSLLYSKQKYDWYIVGVAENKQPPDGTISLRIQVDISEKKFAFIVNGESYKFFKKDGKKIDLFQEFQKGLNVGWFNEVNPVKLSSIKIG